MSALRIVLVGEGPSDDVLRYPVGWLMERLEIDGEIIVPDTRLVSRGEDSVRSRVGAAVQLAAQGTLDAPGIDLLLIHRDADRALPEERRSEIAAAAPVGIPHVAVVPVRETEAWLLHDEGALREAAGNPRGRIPLALPPLRQVEQLADAKGLLYEQLRIASEATGRRRADLNPVKMARRLAELITDWGPLLQLSGFRQLELDLGAALRGSRRGRTPRA
jgi:hypothetical protein